MSINNRRSKIINALVRQDFRCYYCPRLLFLEDATFEHLHPRGNVLRVAGSDHLNAAACEPCNTKYGNYWSTIQRIWKDAVVDM